MDAGIKADHSKIDPTIIPVRSLLAIAVAMMYGEQKYARNNHKLVDNGLNRFTRAAYRHLLDHVEGLEHGKLAIDKESGLPHLAMAGANIVIAMCHTKINPYEMLKTMKKVKSKIK
jgi:queuine/archaeosine tRNA-ribosyltransferase